MSTIEQQGIASRPPARPLRPRQGAGVAAVLARLRGLGPLRFPTTRRGLQQALGLLWLLDGALQFQPFMLGKGFARQILGPAADGQPHLVAGPAHWAANVIAAHPVIWDVPFATVQLALGIGMLISRTARAAPRRIGRMGPRRLVLRRGALRPRDRQREPAERRTGCRPSVRRPRARRLAAPWRLGHSPGAVAPAGLGHSLDRGSCPPGSPRKRSRNRYSDGDPRQRLTPLIR